MMAAVAQLQQATQQQAAIDLLRFLTSATITLFWAVIAALVFTMLVAVAMRLFTLLTPGIDEMDELKKGNMRVGLVMMAFVLGVTGVVAAILLR